ncbi:hypothetical protein SESBI_40163 [Sesbania bispinosa]|nr:hypothetical protein SESBI_40163 [Sesbania bispinosa]
MSFPIEPPLGHATKELSGHHNGSSSLACHRCVYPLPQCASPHIVPRSTARYEIVASSPPSASDDENGAA